MIFAPFDPYEPRPPRPPAIAVGTLVALYDADMVRRSDWAPMVHDPEAGAFTVNPSVPHSWVVTSSVLWDGGDRWCVIPLGAPVIASVYDGLELSFADRSGSEEVSD